MPTISNARSLLLAAVLVSHGLLPPVALWAADSPRHATLHDALSRGDPGWTSLLTGGAEVNARDDAGNTPLHLAALRGNADAVDTLLSRGADAKAVNEAGATPLHYGTGDARIVRALLAHGADPNAASKIRMTPLHGAVDHGDSYAVVRLLVEAGADVNAVRGGDEDAVITSAVFGGDRRTVRYLLDRGARPATNTSVGFATLEMAALMGDEDCVRALLARGADVNTPSGFVGHALNAALYAGNTRIAALLIERGADLRTRSQFGHGTPPMVWSAYNEFGDTTIARLLVSHGADVNEANDAGETALSFALKRGTDTPLVRYLRSVGAREPAAPSRPKSPPSRAVPTSDGARTALVRERAQQSLDLLARTSRAFLENPFVRNQAKCISCHQQNLPAVAFGLARGRGLQVDETEMGRLLQAQLGMWAPKAERARQMRPPVPDPPISIGFGLDALGALGYASDGVTDALVHYLLGAQLQDGSWAYFDQRPPMEGGKIVAVAWAVRAIALYPPPGEERAARAAIQRARDWLEAQDPPTPEQGVFQLLGLAWAGAQPTELSAYVARLLDQQRPDGGWASLQSLESDAWATGTALVALHRAGVGPTHAAYRRGVDFLLRTQFEDGSWWVRSRTWPFQPHFDGQFPHGKDQWISAGGTGWATIALLLTLDPQSPPPVFASAQELIAKFGATTASRHEPADTHFVSTSVADSTAPGTPAVMARADSPIISFNRQIWPILDRSCGGCHGGEKVKGDFRLTSRETLLKGGQSGEPAVVPGRGNESRLLAYVADKVEDLEMPPLNRREKYPQLTADEIALLRAWIDAGATWDEAAANGGAAL